MISRSFNSASISTIRLLIATLLLLLAIPLSACTAENRTVTIDECRDISGNTFLDCIGTISSPGALKVNRSGDRVVIKYRGNIVKGMYLNTSYDKWIESGRPDSGIDYEYYFIYTDDGSDHALLYTNGSESCFDISVLDETGDYFCSVYIDQNGNPSLFNTVSGDRNSEKRHEAYISNPSYCLEKAWEIISRLDPNYLTTLDPATCIPASAEDDSNAPVPKNPESNSVKPDGAIIWTEAHQHIGSTITLYGPIVGSSYNPQSNGQPAYIDMGSSYPDPNRVSLVVWGEDRANFENAPESLYLGKTICVTGEVYTYNNTCYIKVISPDQILIL